MHREERSLNKAGAWLVLGIAAAFTALLTKPDDARIIASFAAAACLGFAVLQALENARIVTTVYEGFVGLVYRSGKLVYTLPPGKHTVWGMDVYVSTLATRTTLWAVPSQEVLTADSIPVKISLVSTASVSDPKVFALIADPSALYYSNAQIALRDAVAKRAAETIVNERAAISEEVLAAVREKAREYGVLIESLEVRDIAFSGEFRSMMTRVHRAKIEGQALLERTRSETAALRNLANAAKMVEENPMLLQLRALQAAEGGAHATIVVGSKSEKPGT